MTPSEGNKKVESGIHAPGLERVKARLRETDLLGPHERSALWSLAIFIHDLAYAAASHQRPTKRLYSVEEAATYLGRSPKAVWELIANAKLSTVRIDRRVHLDVYELDALIDRSKSQLPR
jgi:hypothetical protein